MRFIFRGKKRLHLHARTLRCRIPFYVYRDEQTMVVDVRQLELIGA